MTTRLNRIRVAGFRSLREVSLEFTPVTVLIGPNGAGKSNLLWALEMARMIAYESLQLFVSERGGATYLMHYGPKQTPAIELELEFSTENGQCAYEARLGPGADESLRFLGEKVGSRSSAEQPWRWRDLGEGHRESRLKDANGEDGSARIVRGLLRQCNFYHFHDTSLRSPLRTRDFANAGSDYLRPDGSNLAVFLDGLRGSEADVDQAAWRRLLFYVTSVAPFIKDITPLQDRHGTALQWLDDKGATFGTAHLSDGTLRAIALFAALCQPRATLPMLSCFDEPELGLHPLAIELVASAVRSASSDHQILLSSQSATLLDHFQPHQIVVAERKAGETTLSRLSEGVLAQWLDDYRLSEIYESNLVGGRP